MRQSTIFIEAPLLDVQNPLAHSEQQKTFNGLVSEICKTISSTNIKPCILNLTTGFINSSEFQSENNADVLRLLLNAREYFETVFDEYSKFNLANIQIFESTINIRQRYSHQRISACFENAIFGFIESELANDNDLRQSVYYHAHLFKNHLRQVAKLFGKTSTII